MNFDSINDVLPKCSHVHNVCVNWFNTMVVDALVTDADWSSTVMVVTM